MVYPQSIDISQYGEHLREQQSDFLLEKFCPIGIEDMMLKARKAALYIRILLHAKVSAVFN